MAAHLVAYISETGNGGWEELPEITYVPEFESGGCFVGEFRSCEPEKFEEVWNRYAKKAPRAWFMYEGREGLRKNEDGSLVRQDFPILKFSALLGETRKVQNIPYGVEEIIARIFRVEDVFLLMETKQSRGDKPMRKAFICPKCRREMHISLPETEVYDHYHVTATCEGCGNVIKGILGERKTTLICNETDNSVLLEGVWIYDEKKCCGNKAASIDVTINVDTTEAQKKVDKLEKALKRLAEVCKEAEAIAD